MSTTAVYGHCVHRGLSETDLAPLSVAEHREVTRREMPELTGHQHELLASHHRYDSSRIWRKVRESPGQGFSSRFARAAGWYRSLLPVG